jgi:hypothetical protein
MTLIVEDGTGLAAAESYVSAADCDAYHAARGNTGWSGTEAEKEAALRNAATYLDAHYRYRSCRLTAAQALEWPREAYDWGGPEVRRLKSACCELALRARAGDLFSDVTAQHVESVKVGPIERKMSAPGNGGQKRYAVVDAMLRDVVSGGGNSIAVARA